MYHVVELYRDVVSNVTFEYTPLPYLVTMGSRCLVSLEKKAPQIIKSCALTTHKQLLQVAESTRLTTNHWQQRSANLYSQLKLNIDSLDLPPLLQPIRHTLIHPFFSGLESCAHFVQSDEISEFYLILKSRLPCNNIIGRTLILPVLGMFEGLVNFMVIFPTRIVFPSEEEVEIGTDHFLLVSKSSFCSVVEYVYSATTVIEQTLTMAQWNILGRGPYSTLSKQRQQEIIKGVHQRRLYIESKFHSYEFMATVKSHNEMLYNDLRNQFPSSRGGIPLSLKEIEENQQLKSELLELNSQHTFACWFYQDPNNTPPHKWIQFPDHEVRRLERAFLAAGKDTHTGKKVQVDEGRFEVCLETMQRIPVYWEQIDVQPVCRSIWLYTERNFELTPYEPESAQLLEDAFTYYTAYEKEENDRLNSTLQEKNRNRKQKKSCCLSVPIDGHLVVFKSSTDIIQYKRFLVTGTTAFTSKRRVYRGDPRIKNNPNLLSIWRKINNKILIENNLDNADLNRDVDHLVLIVHGMGDALKTVDLNVVQLRSIIDCASNLRRLHVESITTLDGVEGKVVEYLPIEWHSKFHYEGIDEGISKVTLPAIHKLRSFANDTILDVLFFMSPHFHQVIINEVTLEMNRVVQLFKARNAKFSGKVSIVAHSLGAIICFDILSNQSKKPLESQFVKKPIRSRAFSSSSSCIGIKLPVPFDFALDLTVNDKTVKPKLSKSKKRPRCSSDTLISYKDSCTLNLATNRDKKVPCLQSSNYGSCSNLPEASSALKKQKKDCFVYGKTNYPELCFYVENIFCLGSPTGMFLNVRKQEVHLDMSYSLPTCKRLYNIFHPYDPVAYRIEPLINGSCELIKPAIIPTFEGRLRFQYQVRNSLKSVWQTLRSWTRNFEKNVEEMVYTVGLIDEIEEQRLEQKKRKQKTAVAPTSIDDSTCSIDKQNDEYYGRLCQGHRVDYTLQENEIEITNEYLFALTAHVIYWNNRDTSLFIAKKIFSAED